MKQRIANIFFWCMCVSCLSIFFTNWYLYMKSSKHLCWFVCMIVTLCMDTFYVLRTSHIDITQFKILWFELILSPSLKGRRKFDKIWMYLYTKQCLDTSDFRQICDILLGTEFSFCSTWDDKANFNYFQVHRKFIHDRSLLYWIMTHLPTCREFLIIFEESWIAVLLFYDRSPLYWIKMHLPTYRKFLIIFYGILNCCLLFYALYTWSNPPLLNYGASNLQKVPYHFWRNLELLFTLIYITVCLRKGI
jgi:hypothetical protein